ncbi:unnamed protein product [Acanthoscelides obtectus]|uniref:Uncharacterized protein n=1 Tax=Acanthoscelides obtectus TaxID=200917 RepID=A0A9P0L0P8_ACAOB|nr:unnamed protein product [Acanthoscelides obtectus]CAK1653470.1 hypothetical protein AOBTE_LOCUS18247 [Acanthoscelides obtectus]
MSRIFKYDVVTLIEAIENKPCLWDKTADCFKDKIEKEKAWKDVCAFFEEDFLEKDKKEQHKIGEAIRGKWQNIRDSFVKSLKKKSGQATTKKYMYHDNLTFLLKVVQSDDTQSSIDDTQDNEHSLLKETQNEAERESEVQVQLQKNINPMPAGNRNTSKKPRLQEDVDKRILTALEKPPDEDEAFFLSITPSVRKMSEDDKLEFRMNVLQLIKNINMRNKMQSPAFASHTSTSTSRSSTPFSHNTFPLSNNSSNSQHAHDFQQNQQQCLPGNLAQPTYNNPSSTLSEPTITFFQDL